jgi:hypothetical protein
MAWRAQEPVSLPTPRPRSTAPLRRTAFSALSCSPLPYLERRSYSWRHGGRRERDVRSVVQGRNRSHTRTARGASPTAWPLWPLWPLCGSAGRPAHLPRQVALGRHRMRGWRQPGVRDAQIRHVGDAAVHSGVPVAAALLPAVPREALQHEGSAVGTLLCPILMSRSCCWGCWGRQGLGQLSWRCVVDEGGGRGGVRHWRSLDDRPNAAGRLGKAPPPCVPLTLATHARCITARARVERHTDGSATARLLRSAVRVRPRASAAPNTSALARRCCKGSKGTRRRELRAGPGLGAATSGP